MRIVLIGLALLFAGITSVGPAAAEPERQYIPFGTQLVSESYLEAVLVKVAEEEKKGVKSDQLSYTKFEALFGLQRYDAALTEARAIAAAKPGAVEPQQAIGRVMLAQRRDEAALKFYEAQLKTWPDNDFLNAGKAMALINLDRIPDMIRFEEGLLDQYGGKGSARLGLNNIGEFIRQLPQSERTAVYDKLALIPDSAVALYMRGPDYNGGGMARLDAALKLRPDFIMALMSRGEELRYKRRLDQAMADYDHVITLSPDYAPAYYSRALVSQSNGSMRDAVRDLNSAISLNPNAGIYYGQRCSVLARYSTSFEKALIDCEKALSLTPGYSFAQEGKGIAHLRLKQWDKAADDFDAMERSGYLSNVGLFGRGLAKAQMGDAVGSLADMASARAKAPEVDAEFAEIGIKP
jgi:tetratricopeptide (TPR) repeat protein